MTAKSLQQITRKNGTNIDGIRKTPELKKVNMSVNHLIDLWFAYEEIRRSGKYNMVMDGGEVAKQLGLKPREYAIFQNYFARIRTEIARLEGMSEAVYNA